MREEGRKREWREIGGKGGDLREGCRYDACQGRRNNKCPGMERRRSRENSFF